jgi:hypothetical protein
MWQIYACEFNTREAVKKSDAFYGTYNRVIRYQNRPLLVPVLSLTNPVYISTLLLLMNTLIQTLVTSKLNVTQLGSGRLVIKRTDHVFCYRISIVINMTTFDNCVEELIK